MKKALLFVCLLLAMVLPVHAAPVAISTLYNTGIDVNGVPMTSGQDPHYRILKIDWAYYYGTWNPNSPPTPDGTYQVFSTPYSPYVVSYTHPAWVANGADNKWISYDPSGSGNTYYGYGLYTYQTTFDLTGLDPNSVQITGYWSTDDVGWMYLNLADPNIFSLSNMVDSGASFGALRSFSISGSNGLFQSGLNTLTFAVWDAGNAVTGLRMDITSATANQIPEPGTMLLLGSGLAGLIGYGRRRLKK